MNEKCRVDRRGREREGGKGRGWEGGREGRIGEEGEGNPRS